MFEIEEIEKQVNKAVDAVNNFKNKGDWDLKAAAEEADYELSMMKLMLGDKYESLHWFVAAERDIVKFLESQKENAVGFMSRSREATVDEVKETLHL